MTVESDRDVDWAVLRVYLFRGDGPNDWCGHNLPDAPAWGPLEKAEDVGHDHRMAVLGAVRGDIDPRVVARA
jgi:hypothetical protein